MCSSPHQDERTTYAECCCLHGVAWSVRCALCPRRDSSKETDAKTCLMFRSLPLTCMCMCIQRTLQSYATSRGAGARTACASSPDTSTASRERTTTGTPLSLRTLTATATPWGHMTSLRAFLSSLTTTTGFSSHLPASLSCDPENTRHTAWILTLVGFHRSWLLTPQMHQI